jgi:cyclopropane-fatty-acyl-phospholipid synthase
VVQSELSLILLYIQFLLTSVQIWELFLAWSVIASRQGSATCFQILVVKNLNAVHRIDGVSSQFGLSGALAKAKAAGKAFLK